MLKEFEPIVNGISNLIQEWQPKLLSLDNKIITDRRNSQNRTVKQIVGHMADSASNNTHRVVHMQYQTSPLIFPNYATNGNNDRWIAIQNYQKENWEDLVNLWKYSNLHFAHIIQNIDTAKLDNQWDAGDDELVSLKESVTDYLRHLQLHLDEIDELVNGTSDAL